MVNAGNLSVGIEIDAGDLGAKLEAAVRKAIAPAIADMNKELAKADSDLNKLDGNKSLGKIGQDASKAARSIDDMSTATRKATVANDGLTRSTKQTDTAHKSLMQTVRDAVRGWNSWGDAAEATSNKVQKAHDKVASASSKVRSETTKLAEARTLLQKATDEASAAEQRLQHWKTNAPQLTATIESWERKLAAALDNQAKAAARSSLQAERRAQALRSQGAAARAAQEAEEAAARAATGRGRKGGGRGGGDGGLLSGFSGAAIVSGVAGAIGNLPAATTGLVALTSAVQTLAQAGGVVPGIFAGIGASFGTAIVGTHGMKDAISALYKASQSGNPKDLEKAAAAMKDMAPAAVGVAKAIVGLVPRWQDLQKLVAQNMFDGVDNEANDLANKTFPTLTKGMGSVAKAWNNTIKEIGRVAGLGTTQDFLSRIFGNTANAQNIANKAIDPLIHAVGTLTAQSSNFLPRLADGLGKLGTRFDNFISRSVANGKFDKWVNDGLKAVDQLGNSFLNLGKIITTITSAFNQGGGEGFLGWLQKVTGELNNFLSSDKGQTDLLKFFADGRAQAAQWVPILKDLKPIFLELYNASRTWSNLLMPFLQAAGALLAKFPGLAQAALVGFLAWKTAAPFADLLSGLTKVEAGLSGVSSKSDRLKGALGKLTGTRGTLGLTGLLGGGALQTSDSVPTQALGFASQVAGGALLGSAFGPAGTVIGAGAGAAVAGLTTILAQHARYARDAANATAEFNAKMAEEAQIAAQAQAVQKSLNDALLASKGAIDENVLGDVAQRIDQIPDQLKGKLDPSAVESVANALKDVGVSSQQMAAIVTGSQPIFDALEVTLRKQGVGGDVAATALQGLRDSILQAQTAGQTAGPILDGLATTLGTDLPTAAAEVKTAFSAIPANVPINIDAPGAQAVLDLLKDMNVAVVTNNDKNIAVTAPLAPDVTAALQALGVQVTTNNDKEIIVNIDQQSLANARGVMDNFIQQYQQIIIQPQVSTAPGPGYAPPPNAGALILPPTTGGRAVGGVLPGYSPRRDNMLVPMSGGEGVVIPEAMRALGGNWLYGINSAFRSGISRRGYAMGGVIGFEPGGINPDGNGIDPAALTPAADDTSAVGLLRQIRDLLAGRGGATGPLSQTAKSTNTIANAATGKIQATGAGIPGVTPEHLGPFGTPIKARDPAYEAAAAAIQALGGNAETFLGPNPADYFTTGAGAQQMMGAPGSPWAGRGGADYGRYSQVLAAFAKSGAVGPDLTGLGLDASSPVVKAIVSARNKKKGGLSDDQISDLVTQIIGGGGFTGQLDTSNSSLVSSLQTYRDKLAKTGGVPGAPGVPAPGAAISPAQAAALNNQAGLSGNAQALIAFAQSANGGQYAPASDLANGLADCSGAVSDLVELLTKGQVSPDRLFTTQNEAQVLQSLGAVPGLVPGSLQIGVSPTHTAATLPNGVNFESGGAGGGVVYGGPVGAGDKQFPQQFSLPTDMTGISVPGILASPRGVGATGLGAGGTGGVVNVFVVGGQLGGMPPGGAAPNALGMTPQQQQAFDTFGKPIVDAAVQSAGDAAGNVAGDVTKAIGAVPLPGLTPATLAAPAATNSQLVKEGNPLALASFAGFPVPDFTRQGPGGADIQNLTNDGPKFDSQGNLFSDTASLLDRTFTSLQQQQLAQFQQELAVLNEIKDKVSTEVLSPIITDAVKAAINGISEATLNKQGAVQGAAMAPPIADAVSSAVSSAAPSGGDSTGVGGLVNSIGGGVTGTLFATGGPVTGGVAGRDSVPAMLMPDEHILNTRDVAAMGGHSGVYAFRSALHRRGGIRHFATGGGVIGNDTVGADFFGVSQVPIIGTIVNLLISVLLKVIGVNIEVRDTLDEMSKEVRGFRGDFKHFDASGRLTNDTSGLLDRSSSSEQEVADERIRILKIVIQGLIKYIIEKVIVPIAKAVANAAIQAGGAAAGAAINSQAPGAGGIVSSLIDSAGQAGVDIAAEVGSDFAVAFSQQLVDLVGEGLQSLFPDLMTSIFSGAFLESLTNPLGGALSDTIGGILNAVLPGALMSSVGSLFTGGGFFSILSTFLGTGIGGTAGGGIFGAFTSLLLPFLDAGGLLGGFNSLFDDGGVAHGAGYLPKATLSPERVLSPAQTVSFDRLSRALDNGKAAGGNTITHINAPIHTTASPEQTRDYLVGMMS